MNTDTLRQLFQSPFNYSEYSRKIVHDLFGCNDVYETLDSAERLNPSPDGDQNYFLGQMEDAEGRLLGFFYTRVAEGSDVRRKRVGLRKLIQPYLRYEVDAAIAVFDDGRHWRLSYICDHKEGTTSAKRFSYVLGDKQGQYKTPLERLDRVAAKAGHFKMDDLRDAFSVDALSKEFFDEYHRHYDRIIAELARQGNTGAVFHDYVKKMMGRIVFLHFLQKKGWLNDDPEFLSKLFFLSPYKQDFLEQELEPLFFGIFNTEPDKREQLFSQEHWDLRWLAEWEKLPYLNGGLFERDEVDKMKIKLPASLFENLFKFMASYNFTIDENDPDDADIGIDPEMLGKIFESLLEDNKAKGAFYTPKEIVRYMCKESLIAYLNSKVNSDEVNSESKENQITNHDSLVTAVRQFVEQHEFPKELEPYREVLDTALRNVKICDPAIGSGAFPMGLLNELWRCREALGERATSPSQMGTQATGLSQAGSLCSKEGQAGSLYPYSRAALKREIIENNIYGVDIEKGAIDIARLRFWLSIVVDAEWNVNPDSGPEPLPNFDYKFMQGNSLIESYDGHDLSHIMESGSRPLPGRGARRAGWAENQTGMEFGSDEVKQNLRNWLKMYFSLTDHKEKAYYRELINSSVKNYIVQQGIGPAAETRLNAIDPSANKDFFLWHTWFKDIFDNGGFDIVIGNPPYISVQLMTDEEKKLYKKHYLVFYKRCDLFALFVELSLSHLSTNTGVVTFIIPSIVHSNMSYTKLRDLILNNRWLKEVCYTGGDVFNAPTVDTTILICSKNGNHDIALKNAVIFSNPQVKTVPADYFTMFNNVISVVGSADADSVFSKLLNEQFDQVDEHYTVYQGVVTGNNTAFTFENENDALTQGIDKTLLHPFCHGRDIERYMVRSRERRMLYIDGTIDINDFPNTKKWLLNFKEALDKRNEGKRDVISWCSLHRPRVKSELDLKEKILLQNTRNEALKIRIAATLDDTGIYGTQGLNFIIPKDDDANLHFLLGILNSKLINYLFATKFLNLAIKAEYVKQIRIPSTTPAEKASIVALVDEILDAKKNNPTEDTSLIEHKIDNQVYALYNLTPEEITIIEQ